MAIKEVMLLLINEEVKTKIMSNTVKYYRDKGYKCNVGDIIYVKISDLPNRSNVKIRYICDKCGEIKTIRYCDYNRRHKEEKDFCEKCKYEKTKKTNLLKYGYENVMGNEEIRKKREETNLNRYGVKFAIQNADILNKIKRTCIEKYGVDNPAKSESIKEKIRNTDIKRYGTKHHLSSEEIISKKVKTCMERYGVPYPFMSDKVVEKARKTLYKNGDCPTSKQQMYIHNIYGGKLNYPFGRTNVDIFFENEKIYCEYDGGGHKYMVFSKRMTEEEFTDREIRRSHYLESIGLKEFRIISRKDRIPPDETLLNMKDFAFQKLLKEGYNWIKFDIDNGIVIYKDCQEPYEFNLTTCND